MNKLVKAAKFIFEFGKSLCIVMNPSYCLQNMLGSLTKSRAASRK